MLGERIIELQNKRTDRDYIDSIYRILIPKIKFYTFF
jgi:hypothetical protein